MKIFTSSHLDKHKRAHNQVDPEGEPAYKKQRNVIKQCPTCHKPFQLPVTLPCGYTCCKDCYKVDTVCDSCNKIHTITIKPNVTLRSIQNIVNDLDDLETKLRQTLECAICCTRFTIPTTTPCGHTFCKNCLVRSLDHQHACPVCRDPLDFCPPPTQLLIYIIKQYYKDDDDESTDAFERDDQIPLLVGSLSFPSVQCSIHIFEPKYRLMLRRVMQSSRRRFGLCLVRRNRTRGDPVYCEYGTILELTHVQTLPDGRSIVEAIGSHRFRVTKAELTDGYHLAEIEKVDDLGQEHQQQLEQQQILRSSVSRVKSSQHPLTPVSRPMMNQNRSWAQRAHPQMTQINRTPWLQMHVRGLSAANPKPHKQQQQPMTIPAPQPTNNKEELTTDKLVDNLITFIQKLVQYKQLNPNTHWLSSLINLPSLDRSSRDQIKLVWWIANMMPLSEEEKVPLLAMRTLRERVLTVTSWVTQFDNQWSLFLNNKVQIKPISMSAVPCFTI